LSPKSAELPNLTPLELAGVREILHAVVPEAKCWVFGSRATGRARPFSDLDVLIDTPQRLNAKQRIELRDRFEASTLPFCVDVVEAQALPPSVSQRVMQERLPL
jgi:predicted nucleotidyltransferase